MIKGDILVQLNGVDLRRSATSKNIFTLHDLEQLMDQLALSGKTTNLTVLRHASQQGQCDIPFERDSEIPLFSFVLP